MNILTINSGSSSIKFSLYGDELRLLYEGELSAIGGAAKLELRDAAGANLAAQVGEVKAATVEEAIALVERAVNLPDLPPVEAVGYRVVHPGPRLRGHQRLTPEVLAELRAARAFAPLHDPEAVQIIEETMRRFPAIPHFACFDTVFHETMPEEATIYALPEEVRAEGVRRYGFHGLSCESVVVQMRAAGKLPRRMVIAHLGSGCSVTACVDARSVDTTMGLTPTGGVVMGTRPGDLDPGVIFYLLRREGATVDRVEAMLNHEAGLKALGGVNDMRELRRREAMGDDSAQLAIRVFCRSVVKAVAGFIALYGADALVFTGGIGENDWATRETVAAGLRRLGVEIDAANRGEETGMRRLSAEGAEIAAWVVPAVEDRMIARHVAEMLREHADA